ncbi:SDR family oxidoreductase [Tropicimonas sp. IMCC34043]|uniref:SDR family oxidoreductase n=1 Tax=Tropicimonas sp. IMCC34043 TaxID=2248760 RepID=UPI000E22F21E|nr:SDR family oxidoreductase [Tropicimonas sp. IMCC34043]
MDLGLKGRTAFVLGASSGLGEAIAETLAREGANVILAARNSDALEATVARLQPQSDGNLTAMPVDLADAASVDRAIIALKADHQVDIVVLNGGGPKPGPMAQLETDDLVSLVRPMVESPIRIATALLAGMRERKWGRILTLLSSGVVQPIPNLGLSNTLRLSLVGWMKTLSAEVAGDGVTVNGLIPGRIHTARVDQLDLAAAKRTGKTPQQVAAASLATIPAGRYGDPQEFADAAAFLCSSKAGYITGTSLRVDGGLVRSL